MREVMECDVVIVGAGPSGLATAIRLATKAKEKNQTLNIMVVDKGSEVGSHILSGAVLEPRALDELIPDWRKLNPPTYTPVTHDQFRLLTKKQAYTLPTPPPMKNEGNVIISLSEFCRFLAAHAERLGVNIFPGFAATNILVENYCVKGIVTGYKGLDKEGKPKANYQEGIECRAKQTIFAEGCRGSLTQRIFDIFNLRESKDPQTYALGIKELWELPAELSEPGKVLHTVGWPLDQATYGGSFVYHWGERLLSIGFVVGLDYQNPSLNPYETFQQFKTHPAIRPLLENSKRLAYGARTLVEGGLQSLPKVTFPGGLIVGDAAGFLNVPKIKGIHTAMKSGMLAADALFDQLHQATPPECHAYTEAIKSSWLHEELYRARNIRPGFRFGLWLGLMHAAIDTYLFKGKAPWTLHHRLPDNQCLVYAADANKLTYPKHDNRVTFDLMSSVYLTQSHYDENQPCHLHLKNPQLAISINYQDYGSPEQYYCPAGVYEMVNDEKDTRRLQINAANCIHCKACDIKDPTQNIVWSPPEGGDGPQYGMM
jgi:electron-transferring-flavoprotein dehydrogenase